MIIGIQIVGIIFSLSMIYFAILHFRRREIDVVEIAVWMFVWIFALSAIVFPDLLQPFARTFLFARLFDMMTVGAFLLVIVMTVKTYIATRKIEKKIENLVRKNSIEESAKRVKK